MGLLDGLIGGAVGAVLTNVVGDFIEKQGGVGGLVKTLQDKGLSGAVASWVSTGPNQAVSKDEVRAALGEDTLTDLAGKSGLSVDDLLEKLADVLPKAVDRATPDGRLPGG